MKTHVTHLAILALILAVGSWTFLTLAGNPQLKLITGAVMAGAYVVWGIMHHAVHKDLHFRVVVEYILVGAVALIFLFAILG